MEPHRHDEKCKEVFALLSEYLNPELPPDACQEVELHLNGCPPCIEFADSLRKTVELCRQYRPTEMPHPSAKAPDCNSWTRIEKCSTPGDLQPDIGPRRMM
jgi:hypothetical protein